MITAIYSESESSESEPFENKERLKNFSNANDRHNLLNKSCKSNK